MHILSPGLSLKEATTMINTNELDKFVVLLIKFGYTDKAEQLKILLNN